MGNEFGCFRGSRVMNDGVGGRWRWLCWYGVRGGIGMEKAGINGGNVWPWTLVGKSVNKVNEGVVFYLAGMRKSSQGEEGE